jgi:LacI family transcriptional regulator
MRTASLEPRVCLVEHESMLTAAWLEEQVFGLQKADAILTLNWVCTILSLRGLRELGKTAGRDVPMLSFDDFDLADMLTPSLSVVLQPAEMLGREAATLLFERLKGGSGEPRAVVLPTTLILRESCGCGEQC